MSNRVLTGPYVGKTKPELLGLLQTAQAELASGGSTLTGSSVNGQSFSRTPGPTVLTRIRLLTAALSQIDPDYLAPSQTIVARFAEPN